MANPSIYIYRLVPPSVLIGGEARLAETLFKVGPGDDRRQYSASPVSGCFHFSDLGKLGENTTGTAPRYSSDAERAARSFLETANRLVSGARIDGLAGLSFFPEDARLVASQPVYARLGDTPDHWLCSFVGYQATGLFPATAADGAAPQLKAPVLGAQIDIRVGADSEIVGVWSSWRPVRAMELVDLLPAPSGAPPQIVYQGGGHDEPQEALAPYYLSPGDDGDIGNLSPASAYSLMVEITREDSGEGTRLSAIVTGNTGSLNFAWGAWPLDLGPAGTFAGVSSSSVLALPPGAYNVVLDVEDQVTHTFARQQYTIYCGNAASVEA